MNENENAGIELLEWCKNYNSLTPVLIMSGHGSIESAMTAAKNGAYDFIEKPLDVCKNTPKGAGQRILKS